MKSISLKAKSLTLFILLSLLYGGYGLIPPFNKVEATNNQQLTYRSHEVMTSTSYGVQSNDDWIVTCGGHIDQYVGASSLYASCLVLGEYALLGAFDPSITATSRGVVGIMSQHPLSQIDTMTFSYTEGPAGSKEGILAYLVASPQLDQPYHLVASLGDVRWLNSVTLTPTEEGLYYALLFIKLNASYLLGDVTLSFVQSTPSLVPIHDSSALYFTKQFIIYDETSQSALGFDRALNQLNTIQGNQIALLQHPQIAIFRLLAASKIDAFSLLLLEDETRYLSSIDGTLGLGHDATSIFIGFEDGDCALQFDGGLYLVYDKGLASFILDSTTSPLTLLEIESSYSYEEEADYFVDLINIEGDNQVGLCHALYYYLDYVFTRLSGEALNTFMTSPKPHYLSARTRFDYLINWYETTQAPPQREESEIINNRESIWMIGLVMSLSFSIYAYIKSKDSIS